MFKRAARPYRRPQIDFRSAERAGHATVGRATIGLSGKGSGPRGTSGLVGPSNVNGRPARTTERKMLVDVSVTAPVRVNRMAAMDVDGEAPGPRISRRSG